MYFSINVIDFGTTWYIFLSTYIFVGTLRSHCTVVLVEYLHCTPYAAHMKSLKKKDLWPNHSDKFDFVLRITVQAKFPVHKTWSIVLSLAIACCGS